MSHGPQLLGEIFLLKINAYPPPKKKVLWTSLVIQWLRPGFHSGDTDWVSCQGTKMLHSTWCEEKKKKSKRILRITPFQPNWRYSQQAHEHPGILCTSRFLLWGSSTGRGLCYGHRGLHTGELRHRWDMGARCSGEGGRGRLKWTWIVKHDSAEYGDSSKLQ